MNRSKVMFSGLVFSVVFGLMYWYRDLLGNKEITIMDQSLIDHFDLKLCLTVAVLSMLLIVVLLYSKDTLNKLGYKAKINTHTTSCINLFLDIYLYSEYRLIYC